MNAGRIPVDIIANITLAVSYIYVYMCVCASVCAFIYNII